ncbi:MULTISPECIES: aspartate--ammonia ligase [Fusobacterium]|uniref:aspartate--ammonia ligase n=1 Tax=Fusobacterium TaxID=848 RepID=UPI001F4F6F8B|nr:MULTISPECIES: aspartate--ammonia ligase [Fusobacterium]MCI5725103.1 aspartate--ammonia ligase [Fusobacterium sp.]MDD7411000.1 aspartate--ammonia ligase [Fusobacteriaceae bacterium]MDY5306709.1 aspartate--ammonia ligase [Fusobacterium gastrosuis]MDY5714068.1 aspartate--ammonia ligase [Fusobacterium gastrosuis]
MSYQAKLTLVETEIAIKKVKDFFQKELSKELDLLRVSAPLFVIPESGLNDNLNGTERPVSFDTKNGEKVEIVHSLAKWKRMALYRYNIDSHKGIYTDMNAIRRDEDTDFIHSYYVDQWDWEKIIEKEDRNEEYLKETVRKIFSVFKKTEDYITGEYPQLSKKLPDEIFFITSQELEDKYPTLTPKNREHAIAKEHGAVFIMKIGGKLASGEKHDGRAPDYDDWGLNGDIIFNYPPLGIGLELSSMGIRVDENSLDEQLKLADCEERKSTPYHKMVLNKVLPYTIGGGIGQSRICMFFLDKLHIGEVQSSIWPQEVHEICKQMNIVLL